MNWNRCLSNLTANTTKIIPKVKKVVISTIAIAALSSFNTNNGAIASDPEITTVFHVYNNENYIGTVTDKNIVETIVNNKLQEVKSTYEGFQLTTGPQVTYIPEQTFRSSVMTTNEKVVQVLKEQLEIKADTAAIVIDEKPVAFLVNEEKAEEVIHKLKLHYVNEDQLKAIEAEKINPVQTQPALKENETRILDVRLSKNVSFSKEQVSPNQMVTVEDAVKLLQTGTLERKKYSVQEGDVLGTIANNNGLSLNQMVEINPELNENSVLQIGQEVNITVLEPYVRVLVDKEVLVKETIPFSKEVVEDASVFKGDNKVKQQGQNGIKEVTYVISEQNGQTVAKQTANEKIVKEPVKEVLIKGTKVIPSRGDGNFAWPTNGGYISSQLGYRWGKMHKGIDIARPNNSTIKAADNGVVVSAGWDGGYGNKIVIDHQNGFRTVYAHLASIDVGVGQTVSKGTKIGVMGSTGDSTGVHLHFEVYKNGSLQNPVSHLR